MLDLFGNHIVGFLITRLITSFGLSQKTLKNLTLACKISNYSPFHLSLPFEHLGQSGNFLFCFRTETVTQMPGVLKIYSAFIFR